nr:hypothetical protein [Tanacetum cinerariifolium]
EVQRDPEAITDQVLTKSTTRVPPPVVQPSPSSRSFEIPLSPSYSPYELPKQNPHQTPIPYPSRLNKEKLQDKSDIQVHKFLQIFKKLHFNISLAEALALMLNGPPQKVTQKLRDPGKFLIPCDFPELEKCMALADLGSSINIMPLSVRKTLMLSELIPTRMTLELANRETLLRKASALVDVYGEELILRDDDEKLIFHADSTSKHPHNHGNGSINMINFIDITYEDRFPEVLKIKKSNHPFSGSTTSLSNYFPSLTPFETSDSLLEEFANELSLLNLFPLGNKDVNFDPEADLREIEYLLN